MKKSKPFIGILDLYIIKKFLGTFIFMIALIMSISVVFDINEKIDKFLANDAPLKAVLFDYYMNFIPYYANLFSPLFVFLAVIFFTSKLANNSEIIAMLSNSISFKRLLRPYMFSAAVIAAGSFIFGSFIIPKANQTRIDFESAYVKPRRITGDRDIQFRMSDSTVVYFGSFDLKTKAGRDFSIDEFDGLKLVSRLTAKTVNHRFNHDWVINNYQIRKFDGLEETITQGEKLDTIMPIMPEDFVIAQTDLQMMTTPELNHYIKTQERRGIGNIQSFEIELHSRFASIFSAFILTIIGASLSARKVKGGGMGVNIGFGLILSMGYILFMTVSSTFAVKGTMSPLIAAWIPNLFFSGVAWYLYKRAPN